MCFGNRNCDDNHFSEKGSTHNGHLDSILSYTRFRSLHVSVLRGLPRRTLKRLCVCLAEYSLFGSSGILRRPYRDINTAVGFLAGRSRVSGLSAHLVGAERTQSCSVHLHIKHLEEQRPARTSQWSQMSAVDVCPCLLSRDTELCAIGRWSRIGHRIVHTVEVGFARR